MTSFNALKLFQEQLERHIASSSFKTKVVIAPSSVDERGLIIQLSVMKTFKEKQARAYNATRSVKVRLAVRGSAESMEGLEMALDAIEALDEYLDLPIRLENENGVAIPNTRIITNITEEDSFIDSPDSIEVQDVEDIRIVVITIPTKEEDEDEVHDPVQD